MGRYAGRERAEKKGIAEKCGKEEEEKSADGGGDVKSKRMEGGENRGGVQWRWRRRRRRRVLHPHQYSILSRA